jgi:hypothetical protein
MTMAALISSTSNAQLDRTKPTEPMKTPKLQLPKIKKATNKT